MSHYYRKIRNGEWKFQPQVKTPSQARKSGSKASVTTKLGYLPKDKFLSSWRDQKLIDLAAEHPDNPLSELQDLTWGLRETPDGRVVSAAEFGTEGHSKLEKACLELKNGERYLAHPYWYPYVTPFINWLDKHDVKVLECEYIVGCEKHNTAGTIDGIGELDGKVILWDFKFRNANGGDIKTKHYIKDCAQLAVEAEIIKDQWELDYSPRIYTIIIGADSKELHCKRWTENMQSKGYSTFCAVSEFYDRIEGL